jgi:hypothetical protein
MPAALEGAVFAAVLGRAKEWPWLIAPVGTFRKSTWSYRGETGILDYGRSIVWVRRFGTRSRVQTPPSAVRRNQGGRRMTTSHSDALVLFGVTGDLAHKMIFPALYAMMKRGVLTISVIGVAIPEHDVLSAEPGGPGLRNKRGSQP